MSGAIAAAGVVLVFVGLVLRTAARPGQSVGYLGGRSAGDVMLMAIQAPTGRHHAGVTGEWRPAHRVAGPPYNGRHFYRAIVKARPWPACNLVQDTTMLTADELTGVLAGR